MNSLHNGPKKPNEQGESYLCDHEFPHDNSSLFSRLSFSWLTILVNMGVERPLEDEDLWHPNPDKRAHVWEERLEKEWNIELTTESPSLLKAQWRLYGMQFFKITMLRICADLLTTFSPLLIKELVNFVNIETLPVYQGYLIAGALLILQVSATLCMGQFLHYIFLLSLMVRSGFYGLIYKKSTKLTFASRQVYNSGKVTNIISSDVKRIEDFIVFGTMILSAPLQIILTVSFLNLLLGPAALTGVVILILMLPLQKYLMKRLIIIRKKISPVTDSRVNLTQEIIEGNRVIKYFTWEFPFLGRISELRKVELDYVLQKSIILVLVLFIAFAIPTFAATSSFAIYGSFNEMKPGDIFGALAFFQNLRIPLVLLPRGLAMWADFKVAVIRIQGLLVADEIKNTFVIESDNEFGVKIEDADFLWEKNKQDFSAENTKEDNINDNSNSEEFMLKNISLNIPKGKLVAIVGAVGSGKSSLLNSMLGETQRLKGRVVFAGSVGYCSQQAWIQNTTIRENITFGLPYEEEKYYETIKKCQLEKDLAQFPDRDMTEIGERGVNISGGQKQRINLARLVYNSPEIVLLDDPLSAVDAHVGKLLFECIAQELKGKTRVLVTHQLYLLPRVDYIYVMKDGQIVEDGSFDELIAANGEFASLMETFGVSNTDIESESFDEISADNFKSVAELLANNSNEKRELMLKEDRSTGAVKVSIWKTYFFAAGGKYYLVLLIFSILMMQSFRIANDYWLVFWQRNQFQFMSRMAYILIYFGLGVFFASSVAVFGLILAYGGVRAGRNLHDSALSRLLSAPTSFFDSTPLGRIINRFSKDQDAIDNAMIESFRMFLVQFSNTIATFSLIVASLPLFFAPLVPITWLYYRIQNQYRAISREIKRMESIRRSPMYALLGETLDGLPTIRAYGDEGRFIARYRELIDNTISPTFLLNSAARWLSIRFELLGGLLLFFCSLFGLISKNSIPDGVFGLILVYAGQVTVGLNWAMRQFTETEIAMNAVERLAYYSNDLKQEADRIIPSNRPSKEWPEHGAIVFKDISMKYAPDLPLILKGVSIEIKSNEKIGIVGRTGSGKSSLVQLLFRLVEPCNGIILIDGIDISEIGLHDLRGPLGIIPQDPILFSGTFRSNMDPFGIYTDALIWEALQRANIKSKVLENGGLDSDVMPGGTNLSVGQRQLLCLARSILAHPKILVMDEATANIDYDSDIVIQECIRRDFNNSTVITIAHRINTIMDYDRICVLDKGEVVEFGSPNELLLIEDGFFRSLVDESHNK